MSIQMYLLVDGGLKTLNKRIGENYRRNMAVSAIKHERGAFFVSFVDIVEPTEQKTCFIPTDDLDDEIADMRKKGWLTSAFASENGKNLVVFKRKPITPLCTA